MYNYKIEAADKPTLYADLLQALDGLTAGETDAIANMANAALVPERIEQCYRPRNDNSKRIIPDGFRNLREAIALARNVCKLVAKWRNRPLKLVLAFVDGGGDAGEAASDTPSWPRRTSTTRS